MKTSRISWIVAVAAWVAGCVVSPQPSPPGTEPSLDGDGIGPIEIESTTDLMDQLSFDAAPGTVEPAEGVVIVTNLSNTDAPSAVPVEADGSFSVALAGFPGDTVRFQVKQGATRSQPVDLVLSADRTSVSEPAPIPSCLSVSPSGWVGLAGDGDAQNVLIKNGCAFTVQLGAPTLRRGKAGITFSPTQASALNPGQTAFLTVRAEGTGDEPEDVLFFDLPGLDVPRQALTISR